MSAKKKKGLFHYLKEAFNARPHIKGLGRVPVNWLALGGVAVLGLLNPGFLLIGGALELGYLMTLSHNPRFRKVVDGQRLLAAKVDDSVRQENRLAQLSEAARERYHALVERGNAMMARQEKSAMLNSITTGGLGRLHEIYLNLLLTREGLVEHLGLSSEEELEGQLATQQERVDAFDATTDPAIRRSTEETLRILKRRLENRQNANQRVEFIDSELMRIEQQSDLIVEEAALSRDPTALSQRIDAVTATYSDTLDMMKSYESTLHQEDEPLSVSS